MRAKVIKKSVSSVNENDMKDLNKMFSQITGMSNADRIVILPKIGKIFKTIIEFNKLYSILLNFKPFTQHFDEYKFWFDDISEYLEKLISTTGVDIKAKYSDTNDDPDQVQHTFHSMDDDALNKFYKDLKENPNIKQMVITGSNLAPYKKYISDVNNLDDAFIKREPGLTLRPFAFSSMDLKTIWSSENLDDKAKKFILSIVRHTYNIGISIYETITSPDVDIKKFSKILVDSIAKMKKQIPRCDKAFAIIENSVSMLESNFKNYFRGSVEAGNPSIIVESFIVDISTTQKANAETTNQFKRIVTFLKEKGAQTTDPKIKKLFGMLNSQFSAMDTELGIKK